MNLNSIFGRVNFSLVFIKNFCVNPRSDQIQNVAQLELRVGFVVYISRTLLSLAAHIHSLDICWVRNCNLWALSRHAKSSFYPLKFQDEYYLKHIKMVRTFESKHFCYSLAYLHGIRNRCETYREIV